MRHKRIDRDHMFFTAAAGVLLAASLGVARPPCEPVDCTPAATWSCTLPATNTLVPDRRPVWVINLGGGNYCGGLSGTRPAWNDGNDDGRNPEVAGVTPDWVSNGIPDAFDWLLAEMDAAYTMGYRRIMLATPAGYLGVPAQDIASGQWWTLPLWQQDGFTTHVADWISNHTGAAVGVYAGFNIYNPCDLDMTSALEPDCNDAPSACVVYNNLQPWIDIGVKEYCFDAAALSPGAMVLLSRSSNYDTELHISGEAIPLDGGGDFQMNYLTRNAWQGTRTWFLAFAATAYSDLDTTPFNTSTTEVGVSYLQSSDLTGTTAQALAAVLVDKTRGLVPWVWGLWGSGRAHEAVARAHWPVDWAAATPLADLGVACPADFDYDGLVGSSDQAIILANWGLSGMTLADGELTGDGTIGSADWAIFLGYSWGACP